MLALNPQCCCGGPGITRAADAFGGPSGCFRFINATDDLDGGNTRRWPCWCVPYYGTIPEFSGGSGDFPRVVSNETFNGSWFTASTLGFNDNINAVIYASILSSYVLPYTYFTSDGEQPAVIAAKLNTCALYPGYHVTGGGLSEFDILVNAEDSRAILLASIPAGTWDIGTWATWGGTTATRLYGSSRWAASGEAHFKVWSTLYDGSDYQEHFTIDKFDEEFGDAPYTMNVCAGVVFSVASDGAYEDGSLLGGMTGLGSTGAVGKRPGSLQRLILSAAGLTVFEASGNVTTNAVRFVILDDDDEEVEYSPLNIAYDERVKALAVSWGLAGGFGGIGFELPYTTYITKDIVPGNIIGQDGVHVYANYPSGRCEDDPNSFFGGGGVWDLAWHTPNQWAVVISGKLPRPTLIVGGHVEPPPPPPPPPPNCDGLTECAEIPDCTLSIFDVDDYTEIISDGSFFGEFDGCTAHWEGSNLDGSYTIPYFTGSYAFRIDLATVDGGDPEATDLRANGIRIRYDTDVPGHPGRYREFWVYAIQVALTCTDGEVTIDYIEFDYAMLFGDDIEHLITTDDFPVLGDIALSTPGSPPDPILNGRSFPCGVSQVIAQFTYDSLIIDGVGTDHLFYAIAYVGSTI